VAATGLGAVAAYFFDPDRGRGRRAETADRMLGAARHTGRRLARGYRYVRGTAAGMTERVLRSRSAGDEWMNDETLAHKVESELFRDPSIPKGSININAEHGAVILRGVVDTQDEIEQIMVATMAIGGVRAVRSLLRLRSDVEARPFDQPPERIEIAAPSR
jgi:osmotically-inducible protein OsmY